MMNVSKNIRGWVAVCGFALALVFCTGCASVSGSNEGAAGDLAAVTAEAAAGTNTPVAPPPQADPSMADVLAVGDYLTVKYDDLPTLVPPYDGQIKADGKITLIYNQQFEAAGKTAGQLEQEIRTRYVPQFFKNMTVTVRPVSETRIFYVGGEVRSPGRQMFVPGITVFRAIQSAGYFTDFANQKKVRLTRADGKKTITIDCKKVMKDPTKDVEVYPNDTIIVPRSIY